MESELVSGFMTEHAAVIFVFFFLAEYASIVLICILTSLLFLGGYILIDFSPLLYLYVYVINLVDDIFSFLINSLDISCFFFYAIYKCLISVSLEPLAILWYGYPILTEDHTANLHANVLHAQFENALSNPLIEGMVYGLTLGIKTCVTIFTFIWVRASFPRIRYDQLMSFCWTILLPLVIAFIILFPCVLHILETIPSNIFLL